MLFNFILQTKVSVVYQQTETAAPPLIVLDSAAQRSAAHNERTCKNSITACMHACTRIILSYIIDCMIRYTVKCDIIRTVQLYV